MLNLFLLTSQWKAQQAIRWSRYGFNSGYAFLYLLKRIGHKIVHPTLNLIATDSILMTSF